MFHKISMITLLSLVLCLSIGAKPKSPVREATPARLINVNPDPAGEPWMVGGLSDWTPEVQKKMEQIPVLDLSARRIGIPASVDNSKQQFWRPVFNQGSFGSCSQASSIGYALTYEYNRVKNSSGSGQSNHLPILFTYNFINSGSGNNGGMVTDGWDIINFTGCPSIADFGGNGIDDNATQWMSGYTKYLNAMKIRVPGIYRVITTNTAGIATLKQWLYDKGDGSTGGGIGLFAAGSSTIQSSGGGLAKLPSNTPQAGKTVITKFATQMDHAMSIVGYDDSVRYDFNGDKKYTNEGDDPTKWEIGAFIMVNSWGTSFGDAGFAYMPYRLLALPLSQGGVAGNYVYCCKAIVDHKTLMTYKVSIKHTKRNDISIKAGFSQDPQAAQPDRIIEFGAFNYQGGANKMGGASGSEELEIGLDVTPLLQHSNAAKGKFFLVVNTVAGGNGSVVSYSMIDYRGASPVETACTEKNVSLKGGTNLLSIAYESAAADLAITTDKLPQGGTGDYSVKMAATGGKEPYAWSIDDKGYVQQKSTEPFPAITDNKLNPDDPDDGFAGQELQFEFPFYGTKYKKIYVSTDGSIGFEPVFEVARHSAAIPRARVICPIGMDYKFGVKTGDGIFYKGDDKSATIRMNIQSLTDGKGSISFDVAVTFYPNGEFVVFYNSGITKDISDIACGFSNGNQKDYMLFPYNTSSDIPAGSALRFTPFGLPKGLSFTKEGLLSGKPLSVCENYPISFVCTDANGIVKRRTLPLTISGTGLLPGQTSAKSFSIVKQSTTGAAVRFAITTPENGTVTAEILNASGRTIATLLNGYCTAGTRTITINSAAGKAFAPGTYFLKVRLDSKSTTQKFLILR